MTDNEKLKEYSLKVRKKGRFRYSLENGIISGFLVFTTSNLINLSEKSLADLYFSGNGILTFGIYVIISFTFYWTIRWRMNESTIKKVIESEGKTN